VKKNTRFAQSIDEFQKSLAAFVFQMNRPHERQRRVYIVDGVRAWKDYFQQMNLHIKGIAGKSAPHVFHFAQRRRF
jgi:hypothetical protein